MRTPGQTGRGAIEHGSIGAANSITNESALNVGGAPEMGARSVGRRASLIRMGILSAALMLPGLGIAQTAAVKSQQAASAPAVAANEDPMDTLRSKLASKLGASKAPEAPSPYVVRIVKKDVSGTAVTNSRPATRPVNNTAAPNAKGDNMSEAQMDELDNNKKLIDDVDGGKETLIAEHTLGMEMPVERIKQYIDEILERAERTKHGVHMQEHENAMWIIDYFNQTKTTDSRVLYYPSKVGDDSPFVQAFKKANKGKPGYEERKVNVPTKEGFKEITVYMNERTDKLRTLPKERAVRAAVDVGTAYVILPKGAQIIERTETISGKEVKKYLIADCGNEIFQALSECPPAGKASTK